MTFYQTYRKTIIRATIGVICTLSLPGTLWLHNAYADGRYVLQIDAVKVEIARLDVAITIVDQEIIFADTDREKAKYLAIRSIYEREKEALAADLEGS